MGDNKHKVLTNIPWQIPLVYFLFFRNKENTKKEWEKEGKGNDVEEEEEEDHLSLFIW